MDGGHLRCNSAACGVTLWAAGVSHWLGMKLGFRSSPEKNGIPHIERVAPTAAIPGGEMTVHGRGFVTRAQTRPVVHFGEAEAGIALAGENRGVARVPAGAGGGMVRVATGEDQSPAPAAHIGLPSAGNLQAGGTP